MDATLITQNIEKLDPLGPMPAIGNVAIMPANSKDVPLAKAETETNPLTPSAMDTDKTLSSLSSSSTLKEESDKALSAKPTKSGMTVEKTTKGQDSDEKQKKQNEKCKKKEARKIRGWPDRPPFTVIEDDDTEEVLKKYAFWSDLTWREKYAYQKEFLQLYLTETRKCLPYVRRLFLMIYRISPWRAVTILVLNIVNSFLPALNLQTRDDTKSKLQRGIDRRNLDPKALVKLLVQQLVTTAIDKINDEIMYIFEGVQVTQPLNAHLRQQLEVGIVKGFLELHISEMKDEDIQLFFSKAGKVVENDGIYLITKQLAIFRECTSIAARIATLASLTDRKSWPVLALTAGLPVLDHLVRMIPWRGKGKKTHYSTDWTREERHYSYQLSHINRIAKDINARPEVLIFDAKDWIIQRFAKLTGLIAQLNELGKVQWRKQQPPFITRHIFPLLQSGARALLYLIVAFQPDYFSMPLSQLSFLESSMEGVFSSISHLRRIVSDSLIKDMFQIRNLFECMNITSKVAIPDNPAPYKSHPKGMKIQVKDLTFGYRKESAPVIKDVNFTIDPGEIVSIVGYNGSGKSTIIRLLALLETPTSGNIYINDIEIREYEPQTLRTNMSILFQDFQKFSYVSAYDNIAVGNSKLAGDSSVVKRAAIQSGAHDFIRSFESSYQTEIVRNSPRSHDRDYHYIDEDREKEVPFMFRVLNNKLHLGRKVNGKPLYRYQKPAAKSVIDIKIPEYKPSKVQSEELGSRHISGGQWQRIALARSFMKIKEADLMILDEPSSALDPQAEYEVFKTIMELRKNKTTIYISHRFHTVRAASKIMLFDKGRLAEMGTHDELIQIEGGKYAHLFRLQSEGYAQFNSDRPNSGK